MPSFNSSVVLSHLMSLSLAISMHSQTHIRGFLLRRIAALVGSGNGECAFSFSAVLRTALDQDRSSAKDEV